jgi:hypothetical protein
MNCRRRAQRRAYPLRDIGKSPKRAGFRIFRVSKVR